MASWKRARSEGPLSRVEKGEGEGEEGTGFVEDAVLLANGPVGAQSLQALRAPAAHGEVHKAL